MFPGLRKVTRKPGLAAKPGDGPSKKTGETKKSLNTKSLQQKCFDIPRLNLAKVRQNLDQKECLVASDSHFLSPSVKDESFNRVGLYTSPRFCPQSVKGDKRIFLSRRGTKESPLFNGLGATSSEAHINTTNVKKESSYEDVKLDLGGNNDPEKIIKYSYSDPMAPLLSSAVAAAGNLTTRRHNYESYSTKMWTNRELDSGFVHELENAKARVAKLQAKRLSLGLVTSLQDALAKVAKRDHHSMEEHKPLNSPKVTKEKLLGPLEGYLHQEASKDCAGIQHGNMENRVKEGEAEQVKLKPRKLLLDNNQSSIPLGFGGNPVDCVQTARASNTMHNVPVQSPRSALTERRMSRKDNLQTFLKRKKVDTPILTALFGGAAATPEIYTYIQSRFYRSPEIILGLPYDTMIDIWSFGCILAELYSGCPLFPGENEIEQLACIMEVLGVPPDGLIEQSTKKKMFFDSNKQPRIVPNFWGKKYLPGTKSLSAAIKCNDPFFTSFLECCLRWHKADRLTPEALMEHPWINEKGAYNGVASPRTIQSPRASMTQDIGKRRTFPPLHHHNVHGQKEQRNDYVEVNCVQALWKWHHNMKWHYNVLRRV